MKRFQADTVLRDAELMTPFLFTAWANAQAGAAPAQLAAFASDAEVAEAISRLAAWDFSTPTGIAQGYDAADPNGVLQPPSLEEVAHSVAATLYTQWRANVIDDTVNARLEDLGLPGSDTFSRAPWNFLEHLLSEQPFTGVGASGVDFFPEPAGLTAAERRDVALLQGLRSALDELAGNSFAAAFGNSTDQDDYRWGRLHRVVFEHPLGGSRSLPPAAGFTDLDSGLPGIARDGGDQTVNMSDASEINGHDSHAYEFETGSWHRQVMSPGHPAGGADGVLGFMSLPGGSSGEAQSPLYASQLPKWLTVDYHEMRDSESGVLAVALRDENVLAALVSKGQRSCVQELNKRGAVVGKAQGRAGAGCLRDAAKGKQDDPQACLTADAKGEVEKARGKVFAGEAKRCAEVPNFAYGGADAAADAGAKASLFLLADLFGADLNSAVILKATDKDGARCQGELLKRSQKALETIWKEAGKAKQQALAGRRGAEPAESGIGAQDALAAVLASSAKVAAGLDKLEARAAQKCSPTGDLVAAFPGRCAAATTADLGRCVRARVLCRACRSLNAMDALSLPCDSLDDGDIDQSC